MKIAPTSTSAYLRNVAYALDAVKRTGIAPRSISHATRVTMMACCPIACGACCMWSTLCRVVACPVQCCVNGCAFACSNNGCTAPTDAAISTYWKAFDGRMELQELRLDDFETRDELTALMFTLDELLIEFKDARTACTSMHYALAEVLVRPLTADARGSMPVYASTLLGELMSRVAAKLQTVP